MKTKVLAWGTFCPTCRTVRRFPAALYLTCDGAQWDRGHHPRVLTQIVQLIKEKR